MPSELELAKKINEKINQISGYISQISGGKETSERIQEEFSILRDVLNAMDNLEVLQAVDRVFEKICNVSMNIKDLSPDKRNAQLQEFQENFNQEVFKLIQKSIISSSSNSQKNVYTNFS